MDNKTTKPKNIKITGYKKGALLIPKNSAEYELQQARKRRRLGWPLFFVGLLSGCAPIIADELGLNEKQMEQIWNVWCMGCFSFIPVLIGLGAGFASDYRETTKKHLEDLINNATDRELFNTELVKLAPVFQKMLKDILKKKPGIGDTFLQDDFTKTSDDFIACYTREYLKAHPDDARKFLPLLTVAGVSKNVIDSFIMEYIPDTISFNMAQKISQKR